MTTTSPPPATGASRKGLGYLLALGAVAAATLLGVAIDAARPIPNLSLIFVLPVLITAAIYGWGPAMTAAVMGALSYNYFLIEPRFTLRVADPANVLALVLLATIAILVSAVAAEARRRTLQAISAAAQAAVVHSTTRALVAETTRQAIADRCAEALAKLFGTSAMIVLTNPEVELEVFEAGKPAPTDADIEAARWSIASNLATRGDAYPVEQAEFDFWPLTTAHRQKAALGVNLSALPDRPESPERLVETIAGLLSVALDREAYAAQSMEHRLQADSERLKAELLAAVSHDLKTPLSTVIFTLQSLRRFDRVHDQQATADLLTAAETEAARLARMVENLLDMNRLEAGAAPVRLEAIDCADLATMALSRARPEGHTVVNEIAPGLMLRADPALTEAALANLIDNAARYSPEGSSIILRSGEDDGRGWIEVLDEGEGLGARPEALLDKFVRGKAGDGRPPGTGLGLSIAKAIAEAQGGSIDLMNRADRQGAQARLRVPLAEP